MHSQWTQATVSIRCIGIIIFIFFGLLPSSFVGGAIGLSFAGDIFGLPLESNLFNKIVVSFSMVFAALASAVAIIFISALLGRIANLCLVWLSGTNLSIPSAVGFMSKK